MKTEMRVYTNTHSSNFISIDKNKLISIVRTSNKPPPSIHRHFPEQKSAKNPNFSNPTPEFNPVWKRNSWDFLKRPPIFRKRKILKKVKTPKDLAPNALMQLRILAFLRPKSQSDAPNPPLDLTSRAMAAEKGRDFGLKIESLLTEC